MNEERYILAELKRWLVNTKDYMSAKDVLVQIAKIEADAVLGEQIEEELPFQDVEAD